jgi:hypothetical protein
MQVALVIGIHKKLFSNNQQPDTIKRYDKKI